MNDHIVIIGNGASANRAADVIRTKEPNVKLTLISDEFFPFYYRHKLRDYLIGQLPEEELTVKPLKEYRDRNIRLRLGQTVDRVDFGRRTLFLRHMEIVRFSHLLLCTGGRSWIPETYYSFQDQFITMSTFSEARKLKAQLHPGSHVFLAGGDLVSVSLAGSLLSRDFRVSFLLDNRSFWPLELSGEERESLIHTLRQAGAEVYHDDPIQSMTASGISQTTTVTLQSGRTVAADIVGAFFKLIPNIEFLFGSGLDIDRGILVNEHLETSVPGVYAAGDCAQIYNPDINNYWVSVGWNNAVELGQAAAINLLGGHQAVGPDRISVLAIPGISVKTNWWKHLA